MHVSKFYSALFLFIAFLTSSLLLSPTEYVIASSNVAIVKVNELNVRSGPGIEYDVISNIYRDEQYPVLDKQREWVKLKLSESKTGWVVNWLIVEKEEKQQATIQIVRPTVDELRVRTGPGTSFQIIGYIYQNQQFKKLDENDNWMKIEYNDSSAWVSSKYMAEETGGKSGEITDNPQNEAEQNIAIIQADVLNVRREPSITATIIGKLKQGTKVKFTNIKNGWYEIDFSDQKGWIAGEFVTTSVKEAGGINPNNNAAPEVDRSEPISIPYVEILYDGTNLRKRPTTLTDVVARADQGDQFPIVNKEGDWFEVKLPDGQRVFVAGWIVSTSGDIANVKKPGIEQYFKNKTIVLDPGHGGRDNGTTGITGTLEKTVTIRTAKLLADKLKAAGAKVILTRTDDRYVSLTYRVSTSHYYNADAFISLHYDSTAQSSVNGISTFYYDQANDAPLAQKIHSELIKTTGLNDRKIKYGNFHVLRENKRPSILLELGFLSNRKEEYYIKTDEYQEKVTEGIYTGLAQYFKSN